MKLFLSGHGIRCAAHADDDVAKRPVVHVDDARPGDSPRIQVEFIAVVDVVVDDRRKQIVGQADRVEVAGEVEVDFLHRENLRIAPTRCAPLHSKTRTERRLAQAKCGVLAQRAKCIRESHRGGRLSLTRRSGTHGCHQDELSRLAVFAPRGDTLFAA